jgi:hypothetical protein
MIFAYKMTDDNGGAPCVQDGFLTLAICRPDIRKEAKKGDVIIGIGGKNIGLGRLIYAAKITHIIGPNYYVDPQFRDRKDCIYTKTRSGKPHHRGKKWNHFDENESSFLPRDVGHDWSNARVLKSKSKHFRYLGVAGPGDVLIKYKNLRSLIELSRSARPKGSPPACLKIDKKRREWQDIQKIVRHLWKHYSATQHGAPTHPGTDSDPRCWRFQNKMIAAYRKRHPFKKRKFGFP